MSNINLIIEERAAQIGNFLVGRLLPFRKKRMVGPFAFIDHMGPANLAAGQAFDIASHPHIGLSTLTYLFEGSILHKDSLGTEIEINPGAVNWMTAGKGIVHAEKTPPQMLNQDRKLHGLQIWVALPKALEEMEPSFTHISANELETWTENDVQFKLIAGEAFGKKSPVPVHSPLYFIEIKSTQAQTVNIGQHLYGESGLYILEGSVKSNGHTFGPKQLLVSTESELCAFEISANTTVYIFGGQPFPEERFIEWNFVASDSALIARAKTNWKNQTFKKVPGETDFVPLPEPRF